MNRGFLKESPAPGAGQPTWWPPKMRRGIAAGISLVLLSALLVVGAYFLFLVYAYLAYPLTIMIFTALVGWTIKRKEKRAVRGKPITRHLFCRDCNHLFLHNG